MSAVNLKNDNKNLGFSFMYLVSVDPMEETNNANFVYPILILHNQSHASMPFTGSRYINFISFNTINIGIKVLVFDAHFTPLKQTLKSRTLASRIIDPVRLF